MTSITSNQVQPDLGGTDDRSRTTKVLTLEAQPTVDPKRAQGKVTSGDFRDGGQNEKDSASLPNETLMLKSVKESTKQTSADLVEAAKELEDSYKRLSVVDNIEGKGTETEGGNSTPGQQIADNGSVKEENFDEDWRVVETKKKQFVMEVTSSPSRKEKITDNVKTDADLYKDSNQANADEWKREDLERKVKKWKIVVNHEQNEPSDVIVSNDDNIERDLTSEANQQDTDIQDLPKDEMVPVEQKTAEEMSLLTPSQDVIETNKKELILELNTSIDQQLARREVLSIGKVEKQEVNEDTQGVVDDTTTEPTDQDKSEDDILGEEADTCPVCEYPNWPKMLQFATDNWKFMWWLPLITLFIGLVIGCVNFYWIDIFICDDSMVRVGIHDYTEENSSFWGNLKDKFAFWN